MFKYIQKLGLGSAQWGLNYGVSNTFGKPSSHEVSKIIYLASDKGIKLIDTANSYGNSENVIGQNNLNHFKIITKISLNNLKDMESLTDQFYESLNNLGLKTLYGLLIHNCDELFSVNYQLLIDLLVNLKNQGLVEKIGFSAYNSNQINTGLNLFKPDIVQLPFNVFDQRLLNDGTLNILKNQKIEVHARSIFLQGLLTMNPSQIPKYFYKWKILLERWHSYCMDVGSSPKSVALSFSASQHLIDKVIIGVEKASQLREIINLPSDNENFNLSFLACEEENLINPSFWNIK